MYVTHKSPGKMYFVKKESLQNGILSSGHSKTTALFRLNTSSSHFRRLHAFSANKNEWNYNLRDSEQNACSWVWIYYFLAPDSPKDVF